MKRRVFGFLSACILTMIPFASAQNFSGDARKIAMGGAGYDDNIATKMIAEQRPYFPIVLPFGLIQILRDLDRFDPDDDKFDPVLALEYAANPIHYVIGREAGAARGAFVEDIVNGELSRDFNTYRGFVPANELIAEGLAAPNWGPTIKFVKRPSGTFHGVYVGVGPYISASTVLEIDNGLTGLLASPAPVYTPDQSYLITDGSSGQLALAITGGYRGRIALPNRTSASGRDGIYIGANYHYLRGFRYGSADTLFRFDTDSAGLISVMPATTPALVDYLYARSGSGFALDFGVGAVVDHWELGFGVNGIGNRIDWRKLERKQFTLESLVEGGDYLEEVVPVGFTELRVELPVRYTGSGAYHRGAWSVMTEVSRGFQGNSFHGGVERRFGAIELRGGGRYSRDQWHPSGGLGFNLSERFSIDVAAFTTSTNIERMRNPAIAASLRFNPTTK